MTRALGRPRGAAEIFAAAMVHRGPDGHGLWQSGPAALAHRRLSIIDLSDAGRQPMTNEDGRIAAVVNGEIYNHAELRADLEAKGHRFRSASDSEVVVHLYEEVGSRVPELLRGMFAFAVWDARTNDACSWRATVSAKSRSITANARDGFVFASEIAALLADERTPARRCRCRRWTPTWRCSTSRRPTPFTRAEEAPAGHMLELRCGERPRRASLLIAPASQPELADIGEEEAGARVRTTVEEAVRSRLMSDVPLGAFLSGGIDSSIVVACMARATGRPVQDLLGRFHGRGAARTTSCPSRAWSPSGTTPTITS